MKRRLPRALPVVHRSPVEAAVGVSFESSSARTLRGSRGRCTPITACASAIGCSVVSRAAKSSASRVADDTTFGEVEPFSIQEIDDDKSGKCLVARTAPDSATAHFVCSCDGCHH